ncbi:bicoid stability factor [Arctopsyche grandis]|uniref:bicoid stability factor n=1 Tax=Arctopsyche grandis TaxID=121162 RepID=UPI00406D8C91
MWSANACRQARRALRGVRGVARLSAPLKRPLSSPLQLPTPTALPLSVPVLHKNYSVRASHKDNIEPLLQRLDEDVRRNGRLTSNDLNEISRGIQNQQNITSSQALLAIRCCGELVPEELPEERTKLAEKIWKIFSKKDVPLDVSHYNALLRVYIENNQYICSDTFLKTLEEKGLEPNRVTYQRLMWNHCQKGDVEKASHLLETMRAKSLPLSDAVLDALVLGHARQGNMEGANSVIEAMRAAGLNPTARTYTLLAGGYAKSGDLEGVKRILADSAQKDIYMSDKDLMNIIEDSALGGHVEIINFILGKMQRSAGYNQDAISLIYRLLNVNCHEAALQVYESMTKSMYSSDNTIPNHYGIFFVKHLIKSNTPIDLVVSTCNKLIEKNIAPRAHQIAVYAAYQKGDYDMSLALLNSMKSSGETLKPHYFWPLIAMANKNSKTMLNVVRIMIEDFEIFPTVETLRDYVIPNFKNVDPIKMVECLREEGALLSIAVRSVIVYLLRENRLQDAANVASVYGCKTNLKPIKNSLLNAFIKTRDVDAFVTMVSMTCSEELAMKRSNQTEDSPETEILDFQSEQKEVIGKILHMLVDTQTDLKNVLEGFLSNGLGTTNEWIDKIQTAIGDGITPDVKNLLMKLSDNELSPTAFERVTVPTLRRNSQQLETLISSHEQKGENVLGLKKQLLLSYCRTKDIENIEKMLKHLEEIQFVMTPGVLAHVVDAYCHSENLEKALEIHSKLLEKNPDFLLDNSKIMRFVQLFVKKNRIEEAIKMLQGATVKPFGGSVDQENSRSFTEILCHQMFQLLADKGDVKNIQTITDIIVEKGFAKVSNTLLNPLVKANLVAGDVNAAIDVFEDSCRQHKLTPYKSELVKKLIMDEDAVGLQKVTDLSTIVHGEVNSLYDLVFGFVECNRLKQARRILETPGMRTRNRRLNDACIYNGRLGNIELLEKLFEVTRELTHIDRTEMFQQLLNHYINTENTEKATGLWMLMQEESVPASDKFLIDLANYLKTKDIPIPFSVPNVQSIPNVPSIPNVQSSDTKTLNNDKKFVNRFSDDQNDEEFRVFKNFAEEGKFVEAKDCFLQKLQSSPPPSKRFLRYAIYRIVQSGKVKLLEEIGKHLSDDQKSMVSFDNKRCSVIASTGNVSSYLDELENLIDSAKEEDLNSIEQSFPRGGIFAMLADKNSYERVVAIMQKYCDRGIVSPMNTLWSYHLIENNIDEAKSIWDKYLKDTDIVNFKKLVKTAEDTNNPNLIPTVIDCMKTNPNISTGAYAFLYSRQIDILLKLGQIDSAQQLLEKCLKEDIPMSSLNENTLNQLKLAGNREKVSTFA